MDTNLIFECSSSHLTSERRERVKYRVEHKKIKVRIHEQTCIILFILFIDIDEIPGQRFFGLIFYSFNQSTCDQNPKYSPK